MKTAMTELKETVLAMINNGGTEEDLEAVISHIDNTFLEKEKEHIMEAYMKTPDFKTINEWTPSSEFYPLMRAEAEEYYNKEYGSITNEQEPIPGRMILNPPFEWLVRYSQCVPGKMTLELGYELPLHPDDVEQIRKWDKIYDNIEARILSQPNIKFKIIDNYAKLVL